MRRRSAGRRRATVRRISDGTELFGSATQLADGTRAGNGYLAMQALDSNGDGMLSAADVDFAKLQLWIDANTDGKTDGGELRSLAEFNVASLDLQGLAGTELDNGNLLGLVSSYTTTDGAQHAMADVWFAKDRPTAPPALNELLAAPTVDVLQGTSAASAPASGTAAPQAAPAAAPVGIDRHLLPIDDHKNPPLI
jgi:hypothetical protein